MDEGDPLAGLDEVNWAALTHAYGPASDVPGLVRALTSPDAKQRQRALHKLYGNIFHQGSRYEATAYAVPFLARLAADPRVPRRDEIAKMLQALAVGYDEAYLPAGIDIAGWRAAVGESRSADPAEVLRELDAWVEAAGNEAERRTREWHRAIADPARDLEYQENELSAYDAVRAELPGLRGLLGDDDPRVRAAGAYLLGWFPEEGAASAAALRALLAGEESPGVAANAIVSIGLLLGDSGFEPSLREYLRAPDPLLRWAAAIALARFGSADLGVLSVLAAASENPPASGEVLFLDGDLAGYAAQALVALRAQLPAELIDSLLAGLARSAETRAFPMTIAALHLAFPGGRPASLAPFGELTALQQRVVRTLAGLGPETWRWVDFTAILRSWNLPADRAACRAYAGLGSTTPERPTTPAPDPRTTDKPATR